MKGRETMSWTIRTAAISGVSLLALTAGQAQAEWKPTKSIEFVVTAGPGGGTDNFARAVQNVITKHKLIDQPIVVVNKPGGSGAEGYIYEKSQVGDPHKVVFGTSNAWQQPMVAKLAYNYTDLTPIAAMVQDEFLLWVKQDAPYKTAKDYVAAAKAKAGGFKMGGAQSKDTDELLTRMISKEAGIKLVYVPFKGGGEAAVQLAGGHIDSNVNNPSESLGQWRGGTQRPLCVFNSKRLAKGDKITATESWSDVPTCVESGLNIPMFQQPRTVWLPSKVTPDQVTFYINLMKKVQEQPEWKEYVTHTSQTSTFIAGDEFAKFIKEDVARVHKIASEEGWLVSK
jgi:tripartite-type tricarboxylate transporter receptor subunit TctC